MTQRPVLVTGSTGLLGSAVAHRLREIGTPVRALVRDAAKASGVAADEIAVGDLAHPASLTAALTGVDAVFLVLPELESDETTPGLVRSIADRVERVVYVSARGAADGEASPIPISAWHARVEALIARTGLAHAFIRPAGRARNALGWVHQIQASDTVRWFLGDLRRPLIHERDVAEVAAVLLTSNEQPHPHRTGPVYEITGPQTLSQREQVAQIGQVLGRSLSFEELTIEQARRELFADSPPRFTEAILTGSLHMLEHPDQLTNTVARLLRRPPLSFSDWVADHLADFQRKNGQDRLHG